MNIKYTSLEKALTQLEKSYAFLHSNLAKENSYLYEQFRAASIQAVEFTYKISLKLLRRQREVILPNPSKLREMAFMNFILMTPDRQKRCFRFLRISSTI